MTLKDTKITNASGNLTASVGLNGKETIQRKPDFTP
jgi:hypothetical protein